MPISENSNSWVSFCMSTYQRPVFLQKTLNSIASQTFSQFEVIISDNDPARSAEPVVMAMKDKRFRYFHNNENLGMIKSFNKSVELSVTEFVVVIADDDPIYPDMLEKLHNLYLKYPGYGVYHGGCDVMVVNPEMAKVMQKKVGMNSCLADRPMDAITTYSSEDFPLAFLNGNVLKYMLISCGAVKKEIIIKMGGLPDYGSPYLADIAFTLGTCSQEGVAVINRAVGTQVIHGNNFGFNKNYEAIYHSALGFLNFGENLFKIRTDCDKLKRKLRDFTGRWVVIYVHGILEYYPKNEIQRPALNRVLKKTFSIPGLGKWEFKYRIGIFSPQLLKKLVKLKLKFAPQKKPS